VGIAGIGIFLKVGLDRRHHIKLLKIKIHLSFHLNLIRMGNVQDTGLQFFKSGILFKIQNRVQIGELSFGIECYP
jgi:hypothetical protein